MAFGFYCKRVTIPAHTRHIRTGPYGASHRVRVKGHKRKMCWRNDGRFVKHRGRRKSQ